jgi:acetyltransferase-like isoleucine patch superfamily enzyme
MPFLQRFEPWLLRVPRGLASRFRLFFYRQMGLKAGRRNRLEAIRCRRLAQIEMGDFNAFTEGCWLWPEDAPHDGARIRIGSRNYFNRDVMIDACGLVEIGDGCMFGPRVYIADSNHSFEPGRSPHDLPMARGRVKIGNGCWIGAGAIILKDVEIGNGAVVAAGAVVTRNIPSCCVAAGVPAKVIKSFAESAPEPEKPEMSRSEAIL